MQARKKLNKETPSLLCLTALETGLAAKGFKLIAGVDEAGRGPLAGPVVAAAVIFENSEYPSGVRDSKQLSPKLRDKIFYEICEKASCVGVGIVNEDIIDRINILQATHLAMTRAVRSLEQKPDFVLFDGVPAPGSGFPQKAVVGGDRRSITIAAASIIAKVSRDRIMFEHDIRFPEYGFLAHKGYGTKAHIDNLQKFGPCRIHRKSFRPVAEALKMTGTRFRIAKNKELS